MVGNIPKFAWSAKIHKHCTSKMGEKMIENMVSKKEFDTMCLVLSCHEKFLIPYHFITLPPAEKVIIYFCCFK